LSLHLILENARNTEILKRAKLLIDEGMTRRRKKEGKRVKVLMMKAVQALRRGNRQLRGADRGLGFF